MQRNESNVYNFFLVDQVAPQTNTHLTCLAITLSVDDFCNLPTAKSFVEQKHNMYVACGYASNIDNIPNEYYE